MELFEGMIRELRAPWSHRLSSILVDPHVPHDEWDENMKITAFGRSSHVESGIWCQQATITPFVGLQVDEPPFWFHFPDENVISFPPASWFGVKNATVLSIQWETRTVRLKCDENTTKWAIPEKVEGFPINLVHFFSGAYGGWERASFWLHHQKFLHLQQTIAIDNDEEVMKVWQIRNEANVYVASFSKGDFHAKNIGIYSGIENDEWLNVCQSQSNSLLTMSPPCQPWSMGGKAQGFESNNGLAFAHAIRKVKMLRPLCVCAECADQITKHSHFRIIKAAFAVIGYKLQWMNVMNLDGLGMQRSRWLAVWVRNDFEAMSSARFRLFDVQQNRWSSSLYSFQFPCQVEHQLKLTNNLLGIYGDSKLLPKSFHVGLGATPSVTDVLHARCLSQEAIVPTLVASYTQQHLLDPTHIENKGIFASLIEGQDGFQFIDPFRFISLLGTPCLEIVPVAIKIDVAFKHLGNSISCMHALTCILVATTGIKFVQADITSTLMQCWQDRCTTDNSIVIRNKDYAFVVPNGIVTKAIIDLCIAKPITSQGLRMQIATGETIYLNHSEDARVNDIMKWLGIEKIDRTNVSISSDTQVIEPSCQVVQIINIDLYCRNKSTILFKFTLNHPKNEDEGKTEICVKEGSIKSDSLVRNDPIRQQVVVHDDCSPTLPYHVQHEGYLQIGIQEEQTFDHWEYYNRQMHSLLVQESVYWIFFPESDTPHEMIWPRGLYREVIETRAKFLQMPDDNRNLKAVECFVHPFDSVSRVILMIPSDLPTDLVAVLIWNEKTGTYHPRCIEQKIIPWNVAVKEMPDVSAIQVNREPVAMFGLHAFRSGDVIQLSTAKRQRIDNQTLLTSTDRASLFKMHGPSLASDEIEWCAQQFNDAQQNLEVLPPVTQIAFLQKVHEFVVFHGKKGSPRTVIPILFQDHWAACEIKGNTCFSLSFINIPADFAKYHLEAKDRVEHFANVLCTSKKTTVPAPNGFCGWALLFRWAKFEPSLMQLAQKWYDRAECTKNDHTRLLGSQFGGVIFQGLWTFAAAVRCMFLGLFPIVELPHKFQVGSTGNQDAAMTTGPTDNQKVDPWLRYDPWTVERKQLSKWEDLRLPKDHYFKKSDNTPTAQLHRQQLNSGSNAIAFSTRANVIPTFSSCDNKDIGLLIPASDKTKFDTKPELQTSGPFEIVVQDDAAGTVYKRQVFLVQLSNSIRFEMPKATYKTQAPELKELVIEIDERLLGKEAITAICDRPLDAFKKRLHEQIPTIAAKGITVYAFRIVNVQNPNHRIFQTMCKVPTDGRQLCLERSGMGDLFIRDYIPKGKEILDVSTIPRFWSCDKSGKEDALRTASNVEGFAGLVLTKRGVAVRAWCGQIASVRQTLLPNDERICKLNIGVIPRFLIESTGWPTSIGAEEVVKATNFAVKLPPIPTRCFKMLGVTTWTLAFQSKPTINKFLIDFNNASFEIILSESQVAQNDGKTLKQTRKEAKGKGKGFKGISTSDSKSFQNSQEDAQSQRISVLEAKFNTMERRQDSLESKINDGFSSVNDQLRQVLQAITPKSVQEPTGLSPPPKMPKL